MADVFSDFLATPGAESYLALRTAILAMPEFDMFSPDLAELEQLADDEAHEAVPGLLPLLMPNWLLTPRVHLLLARSAEARGEQDLATAESRMVKACLIGLRATGEGTAASPYRSVHTADEYDLAEALGKKVTGHRRDDGTGRIIDVLLLEDGGELHFDMTDSLAVMGQQAAMGM